MSETNFGFRVSVAISGFSATTDHYFSFGDFFGSNRKLKFPITFRSIRQKNRNKRKPFYSFLFIFYFFQQLTALNYSHRRDRIFYRSDVMGVCITKKVPGSLFEPKIVFPVISHVQKKKISPKVEELNWDQSGEIMARFGGILEKRGERERRKENEVSDELTKTNEIHLRRLTDGSVKHIAPY